MTKHGSPDVKDNWVKVRLSGDDKRRAEAEAKRHGLSLSAWIRMLIRNARAA